MPQLCKPSPGTPGIPFEGAQEDVSRYNKSSLRGMQCAKHQRGEARMHRKWRMTMHRLGNPCTRSASIRKYLKIQSNRSFVFATRISSSLCKNVTKTPLYMFFQTFTRLIRNQYVKEQGSMLYCRYRPILRNIYSSISYYFI